MLLSQLNGDSITPHTYSKSHFMKLPLLAKFVQVLFHENLCTYVKLHVLKAQSIELSIAKTIVKQNISTEYEYFIYFYLKNLL